MARYSILDHPAMFHAMPIRVWWDGWESDTIRLAHAGWEFSAQQDPYRRSTRLAMRHGKMHGLSQAVDMCAVEQYDWNTNSCGLIFKMDWIASDIMVHIQDTSPMTFRPVDVLSPLDYSRGIRFQDAVPFATPVDEPEHIVVAEPTIAEMLSKIRDMQEPDRLERVHKEAKESRIITTTHAKIVSINGAPF